jgi:hypothetical protein
LILLGYYFNVIFARPLSNYNEESKNITSTSQVVSFCQKMYDRMLKTIAMLCGQIDFMKKFGYLGKPQVDNIEALFTEDSVIYGIMKLQEFAGIYQSGQIDEATLKVRTI